MQIIKEGKYYELTAPNWNDAVYFYVVKVLVDSESHVRAAILAKNNSDGEIELQYVTINIPPSQGATYTELTIDEYLDKMGFKYADN